MEENVSEYKIRTKILESIGFKECGAYYKLHKEDESGETILIYAKNDIEIDSNLDFINTLKDIEKRLGIDLKNNMHSIWSDRIILNDYKKWELLSIKHFGSTYQNFDDYKKDDMESFLKEYLNDYGLKLFNISKERDLSTGFYIWRFDYETI